MIKKRKKKYRSVISKRIFKSLQKLQAALLVVAFTFSVFNMGGTNAGNLDQESSENNVFIASTLDFSVSSGVAFSPKISPSMETTRTISISKEGLENFQYRISADNFSGDTELCDELEIKDDLLGSTFQDLDGYISAVTDNLTTNLSFTVRLADNDDDLADKDCDFDLVVEAWQIGLLYGAGGFVDVENISSTVESEHWTNIADHLVINEVFYDVDGSHGSELDNEWVEIYNPTSSAVNLENWKICVNTDCDVLTTSDSVAIPANGYAVVTKEDSTWGFWSVPGSAIKIVLGLPIGGGLGDSGNQLILKNDSGDSIDTMSYGAGLSDCPDVDEGHSLARKPAGQDTDDRSDFEDLSSPNPGTNPHTVVMNEIMPNPTGEDSADMPGGEWVELYNYGKYDINLSDWKLKDGDGDDLEITDDNTDTESATIKAGKKLVVYRNGDADFDLNDDGDTISLIDEKDLIKDAHTFEATPEDKSIARFPDAVGPWIDPDGTPGEDNVLSEEEMNNFRLYTFEKCFSSGELDNESEDQLCDVYFLQYLGMIDEVGDEKMNSEMEMKLLLMTEEIEKNRLVELIKESREMGIIVEDLAPISTPVPTEIPEPTPEVTPVLTPIETPGVIPDETPTPDSFLVPTSETSPTPTPTPEPTPTPKPTETPKPSPEPTEIPEPTKEPEPAETSESKDEPAPAEVVSQEQSIIN